MSTRKHELIDLVAWFVAAVDYCPYVLSRGSAGTMSKPLINRCVRPDIRFSTCISVTPRMAHMSAPTILQDAVCSCHAIDHES